jgi:hypothetical protein
MVLETSDHFDSISHLEPVVRKDYLFHGVGVPFNCCNYRFDSTLASNILVMEVNRLTLSLLDEITSSRHDF